MPNEQPQPDPEAKDLLTRLANAMKGPKTDLKYPVKPAIRKKQSGVLEVDLNNKDDIKIIAPNIDSEDKTEAEPEVKIDLEQERTEQIVHTVDDFIEAQKVLTALRMKDINERYKGKSKNLRKLKSWLAGEFDWGLTNDGEIKRRSASFITRKLVAPLLNRRGLGVLASAIATGGSLPAIGTLIGGYLGWLAGEVKQSRAKKEDNLELSQKEIVKSQVEAILKLMPSLKAGRINNQTEMADFINEAASIIQDQIREEIATKHERVDELREKWDKTKGKMFTIGAITGLMAVMGPTIAAAVSKASEEIAKGVVHFGTQNFDKAMQGNIYPQNWLDITHNVIKKGGDWYYQIKGADIDMANQMGYHMSGSVGDFHIISNMSASVARNLERIRLLQESWSALKIPLLQSGIALVGALVPGLFGKSKKVRERIAEIINPEEKTALKEKEQAKVIPLMPRQPILPTSEAEIKQLPAWQRSRFYLIAFSGEYGRPAIGLAQFNGIIYNDQGEPCYDLQFFKTIEGGGQLIANDRLNLPVSQFGNIARMLISQKNLAKTGYYQRRENQLINLLPQSAQEQLRSKEEATTSTEEPSAGEEAEEIEDQIDSIEGLTKHLEELNAEANLAKQSNPGDLPRIEQEINETRTDLEKLLAKTTPAPHELSAEEMEEYDEVRALAQITLTRVPDVRQLNPREGQTPHERFLELTRELWTDLAVHGFSKNGKILNFSDLDGKTCLGLLEKAGINIKNVKYVRQGDAEPGRINLDTGNRQGVQVPKFPSNDTTTYIDHHGESLDRESSAAGYTYYVLTKLGLLEPTGELNNMVAFVTETDNLSFPAGYDRNWYENESSHSLYGLAKFIKFDKLYKFFVEDKRDPRKPLSEKDLKTYGLDYKNRSTEHDNTAKASIRAIKKLEGQPENTLSENGGVIITEKYGRILVDTKDINPTAAKLAGFDMYIKWDQNNNSFQISSFTHELTDRFPQGVLIRGQMWIKPKHDTSPLTFTLADVISQLSDGQVRITAHAPAVETLTETPSEEKKEEPPTPENKPYFKRGNLYSARTKNGNVYFLITSTKDEPLDGIAYNNETGTWKRERIASDDNNVYQNRVNYLTNNLDNNGLTFFNKASQNNLFRDEPDLADLIEADQTDLIPPARTKTAAEETPTAPTETPATATPTEIPAEAPTPAPTTPAATLEEAAPAIEEKLTPPAKTPAGLPVIPAANENYQPGAYRQAKRELGMPEERIRKPFIIINDGNDTEEVEPEQIVDKTRWDDPETEIFYMPEDEINFTGEVPFQGAINTEPKHIIYKGKDAQGRPVFVQLRHNDYLRRKV